MDGSHGDRRSDVAMVGEDGDAVLALVGLGAGRAEALAPCLATVLVPSPGSPLVSRWGSGASGRPRATHACQSDPASAHVAQTVSMGVSGRAGVPLGSCGMGHHYHGLPV
jgi:hypothetical protein